MSLRTQLLAGLALLVALAVLSAGFLVVATTAQALAQETGARAEQAAAAGARTLSALLGQVHSATQGDNERANALATLVLPTLIDLAGAVGADEAALFDARGHVIVALPGDGGSSTEADLQLGLALAGAPPFVRPGRTTRAYAPVVSLGIGPGIGPGGARVLGALRLGFTRARILGGALARTRALLIALGCADALVLLLTGWLTLGRSVVRPIQALESAATHVAEGDFAVRVPDAGATEIARVGLAFNRMTKALGDKEAALAERQEQLVRSEKLASVGRLAAGVAHEIGNPLSAVLGYLEVLRGDGRLPDDVLDIVARVRGETLRIHETVQDLLAYARAPEARDGREALAPTLLPPVVAAAVALCRPQPRFRDVELAIDLPPDLPPVTASAGRLVQVLLNLLLNAADAMGGAGSTPRRIHVEGRAERDRVELAVIDGGPGVPEPHRTRLFDPFFTTKDPGQGTGLGLFVSSSIVTAMGGTLALAPQRAGEGARFVIALPAAPGLLNLRSPAPAPP